MRTVQLCTNDFFFNKMLCNYCARASLSYWHRLKLLMRTTVVEDSENVGVDIDIYLFIIYLLNIFKQGRTYRRNHCFTMLPCTMKSRTM